LPSSSQQIRREDEEAAEPSPDEVNARLAEIRKELPAAFAKTVSRRRMEGVSWSARSDSDRVDAYMRYRLEILRFIEQRFRQAFTSLRSRLETYYNRLCAGNTDPEKPFLLLERVSHASRDSAPATGQSAVRR